MTAHFSQGQIKLLSIANAFPNKPVGTEELIQKLRVFCDDRTARKANAIANRLSIESRYLSRNLNQSFSHPNPDAPDLCQKAINLAGGQTADFLICHTTTPHTLLPSNAAWVAERMGFARPFMELRQACTGFANALQIAVPMLNFDENIQRICVTAVEVGSVYFSFENNFLELDQLINFVQMGDGASAVVLAKDDGSSRQIIKDCYVGHIGLGHEPGFQLKTGGSQQTWCDKKLPYFEHNALTVRKQGPELFLKGLEALQGKGYSLNDFAYILPHQANGNIDRMLADTLNIDRQRVINNAKQWGNLGSVAIWASFADIVNSGKLKPGDQVAVLGAEATKYMYGGFVYTH